MAAHARLKNEIMEDEKCHHEMAYIYRYQTHQNVLLDLFALTGNKIDYIVTVFKYRMLNKATTWKTLFFYYLTVVRRAIWEFLRS